MSSKNFLSKTLNTVSVLTISSFLWGAQINDSWGMDEDPQKTSITASLKADGLPEHLNFENSECVVSHLHIPGEIVRRIFDLLGNVNFMKLSEVSKGFFKNSWQRGMNRTLPIKSPTALEQLLEGKKFPHYGSVSNLKITPETKITFENLKKIPSFFPELTKMELEGGQNNQGLDLFETLIHCLKLPCLTQLSLQNFHVGKVPDFSKFTEAAQSNTTLRTLSLRNNKLLGDNNLPGLMNGLNSHPTLTSLDLSYTNISEAAHVFNLLKDNNVLKKLNLSHNLIRQVFFHDSFFLNNTTLTELNLEGNKSYDAALPNDPRSMHFAKYYGKHDEQGSPERLLRTPLKKLNLAGNEYNDPGAQAIAFLFKESPTLIKLNLKNNKSNFDIRQETLAEIKEITDRNKDFKK